MKKWSTLVLLVVLGLASGASAALTLVGVPTEPIGIGETITIIVSNSEGGAYSGWLEINAPAIVAFDGAPEFTPAGDPGGSSQMTHWPDFGAWYEFSVNSFPPSPAIAAGEHILIHVVGVSEGTSSLRLYASDGETLLDQCSISVIPEPTTVALLGLGSLLLRRRR
jgi:hypothetical protein